MKFNLFNEFLNYWKNLTILFKIRIMGITFVLTIAILTNAFLEVSGFLIVCYLVRNFLIVIATIILTITLLIGLFSGDWIITFNALIYCFFGFIFANIFMVPIQKIKDSNN